VVSPARPGDPPAPRDTKTAGTHPASPINRPARPGNPPAPRDTQTAGTQTASPVIRPARPGDLAALRDFFGGLSVRTRYQRFFAAITPTQAMLRFLAGDAGRVAAVVATCADVIVGHAMAVDQTGPDGTRTADIGVVVADAWQGRGVGSALTRALIDAAQARGVTSLTMDVQHSNREVLAMVVGRWPAARTSRGTDGATINVPLPHPPQPWPVIIPPPARRPAATPRVPAFRSPLAVGRVMSSANSAENMTR
jgi:L-amino acid N-acyltransferase YncA